MKKLFALILSAVVLSTVFTACGCASNVADNTEVTDNVQTLTTVVEPTTIAIEDVAINNSSEDNEKTEQSADEKSNTSSKEKNEANKLSSDKKPQNSSKTEKDSSKTENNKTDKISSSKNHNGGSSTSSKPVENAKPTKKPSDNTSATQKPTQKPVQKPTKPDKGNKTWHEAVYKTVNHPAEYKKVWVVDQKAYTREEPIYKELSRTICNDCGLDMSDWSDKEVRFHCGTHGENGGYGSYRCEYRDVLVGTKTVTIPEKGHYENKVVKDAWTEKVLVKEAGWY